MAVDIPHDDDVGSNNRYYKHKITDYITALQSGIRENANPACQVYVPKTYAWDNNTSTTADITWLRANTNLIGSRDSTYTTNASQTRDLRSINIWDAWGTYDSVADMIGDGSDAQIQQNSRATATSVSNGLFVGRLTHSTAELSLANFTIFVTELAKYNGKGISIVPFSTVATAVTTSGSWTESGSGTGIWNRTYSSSDFHLQANSPAINAGVDVGLCAGTDFRGWPACVGKAPPIGALTPRHRVVRLGNSWVGIYQP